MRRHLTIFLAFALVIGSTEALAAPQSGPFAKKQDGDVWQGGFSPAAKAKERSPDELRYRLTYSDAVAARLGVVDGKARFFRYYLDGTSQNSRSFEGGLDGNGVKFRLKW